MNILCKEKFDYVVQFTVLGTVLLLLGKLFY